MSTANKPDSTVSPQQLTAWVLGELDSEARTTVEERCSGDARSAAEAEQTRAFCGLLRDCLSLPEMALREEDRAKILEQAGQPRRGRGAFVVWLTGCAAACLAAGVWLYAQQRVSGEKTAMAQADTGVAGLRDAPINKQAMAADKLMRDMPGPPAAAPPGDRLTGTGRPLPEMQSDPPREILRSAALPRVQEALGAPPLGDGGVMLPDSPAATAEKRGKVPAGQLLRHSGAPGEDVAGAAFFARKKAKVEPGSAGPGNLFQDAAVQPRSTFRMEVDTASCTNIRRLLNRNEAPPVEAVRLEELVNYFPYDYALPGAGAAFAVHVEAASAPWNARHRLVRVGIKGRESAPEERPPLNLAVLVDVSGSMNAANRLPLVQESLRFLAERLTARDSVSLVTSAAEGGLVLPPSGGEEKARILAAIDGLRAGGATNEAGGIAMAYAGAVRQFRKPGFNTVVLVTGGECNARLVRRETLELIAEKAKTGIFLSVLGYGMEKTTDDTMQLLAERGSGRCTWIDSLSEARRSLADQLTGSLVPIAKDVKIHVIFNPAVVRSYRRLGDESPPLSREDAPGGRESSGEVGAGHTVTALYEWIPVQVPEEAAGRGALTAETLGAPAAGAETLTVQLQWKAPGANTGETMEVALKDDGRGIAGASGETRWAVAVAGFARLLRDGLSSGLKWEEVRAMAAGAKGGDPLGFRGDFLSLIDKAAGVRR